MGVKHFVFLDNGSTDRTVENALCARGRDRTVNECPLPEIREHDEEVFGREILARQVESLCRYRRTVRLPILRKLRVSCFPAIPEHKQIHCGRGADARHVLGHPAQQIGEQDRRHS